MRPITGKKQCPYPEIQVVPREHRGFVVPLPQFASTVIRNGKVVRRGEAPAEDEGES